jgi:hypothetical protein
MIKSLFYLFLLCAALFACGQKQGKPKNSAIDTANDTVSISKYFIDTNKIAILPIDVSNPWLFKNCTSATLTNQELKTIDRLLKDCVKAHNNHQDTAKQFSEYIDLQKYRIQYVPFINPKGVKKVYVNCFCFRVGEFNYWKESLVEVDDGGSCFFNFMINLTELSFEQLITNGYG